MKYKISDIANILGLSNKLSNSEISILLTDSRLLTYPEESLFFALHTSNNDGHKYIKSLYDKGVHNFVVEYIPQEMSDIENVNFLVVENTTIALQTIACHHRKQFNIPTIGITGSRGKTIVKEWLYQLLQNKYNIARSPRSYNSQIGVPLSIWEMDKDTTLAIFEAGISQPSEMQTLQKIINPNIGILTNLGDEHNDGFKSIHEKCHEKILLFKDCDCVIYNKDNTLIDNYIKNELPYISKFTWSHNNPDTNLYISNIDYISEKCNIHFIYNNITDFIELPFSTDYCIENAIHCLALMLYLHIDTDYIKTSIQQLSSVNTRLNVIEGANNCILIQDTYTSDFHSLLPALNFMSNRMSDTGHATVIISDVMHETLDDKILYHSVAQLLTRKGINKIIGIGSEFLKYQHFFCSNAHFYKSTQDFLDNITTSDFENEVILIKGAPNFNFSKIITALEARQHNTVLEVNLDSIVHNYNIYRSQINPSTGIVCMVKASGYGAGSYELAKTLQTQGASYLAVAVLDEGIDLRKAGITMPIMVLNPQVENYQLLFSYNLEPEIYNFDILKRIIREAESCGLENYPVHIKLDTGMHRLGFLEENIDQLIEILNSQSAIKPYSVFSHLAAADCPDMDDYTMQQFEYFNRCCEKLQSGFKHHILRHILNSTGITRFPSMQCDLVRLGICLYGIPTMNDGSQDNLKPVSALHSAIISIKNWTKGTTIGYSRRGLLTRDSRIATIPIGYADGLDRHLGNGNAYVFINGHRCPTIGNICMDVCMIDVTDVDCSIGDTVEIFGQNISVMELAEKLNTIPYEILTSISNRVKRVYYRE